MEKFDYNAGRVSLAVVWAWATHLNFTKRYLRALCGYFEHQRRVQFEGFLLGSNWSCLLLRMVLQDALSEVMKMYPPMKLKVFLDDIVAFVERRNKELAVIAEQALGR